MVSDVMNVILSTEEHFRIRIGLPALLKLLQRHDPPDATAWEFCVMVRELLDFPPRSEAFGEAAQCSACGYCLRGLSPMNNCPECGLPLGMEGAVESVVRKAIAKARRIPPANVTPETLLVQSQKK